MNPETSSPTSVDLEFSALMRRLSEAEAALQAHLADRAGGEPDDSARARPLRADRGQAAAMQAAVLDALPAHIALLNHEGVILTVNESWRRFALANLLRGPEFAVGQNYLRVCEAANGDCSEEARAAAEGIRRVLRGELPEFALEYPCHSPNEPRWFRMMVTPLRWDGLVGTAVMHVNITQRKLTELTLQASEANMVAAQRIAHFGSWELDLAEADEPAADTLRWSDEMFRIAGFEPGSVAVSRELFYRLVPPEDHARIRQAVEKAIRDRGTYTIVHRLVRPDGQERFVHEVAQVTLEEGTGRPLRMIGTAHDITEQRMAEEALRRGEEEQRQLARQLEAERARLAEAQRVAKMGSWETDLTTLSVLWSVETHRIFETDPATVRPTHQSFLEIVHPEDRAMVDAAFVRSLEQNEPGRIGHRLLLPDGRIKHVEERWEVWRDETGKPVRVLGTCRDITEQRQAEAEARRTSDLLRAVADGTTDALFVKDREGRYLLFNEAAARFVGKPVHEVLGRDDTALFGPEDARKVMETDRRVIDSNQAHTTEEVLTAAGITRTYSVTKVPYRDAEGNVIGLIGISRDITERKEAEQRLREMGERLSSTLESLTDGFFTLDHEWRFTYVNREAERLFRVPRSELLGALIWDKFPDAAGTVSQREYERAMTEKVTVQFETFYPPLDMWFDARAFPSSQGLAVYFRDVTASRAAAERLRASEERFRLLSKATNDAVWDWDLATDRVWWNDGHETLFGRSRDAVPASSKSWTSFIHPEDRQAVLDGIHRVIDGQGTDWAAEYRFLRSDGSYVHVADRGHLVRDDAGNAVRMIGGMTDLTERRRAEEKLEEQAALLDKAQDAILVRDLEHRILYWNKSAARLYGWDASEVLGRPVQELLYLDPTPFLAATQATLEKGEWVGELTKKTKDGRKLTIEGRWTLVRDDAGRPKSVLAIDTDITERKKLEAQFLRAQRMESIGTLAGGIAHDLNNVLAPIMMSIDLLKMDLDPKERLEILSTIETSARRGADMVSQVLSFARGVEGRQIEIQVRHLLRDILKIVNETFLKTIVVRTSLPQDLWTLSGDPTQLHQVLLNLCVNARDAMPHGGTLTLSAENLMLDEHYAGLNEEAKPGPHLMIQVEDTGTGIPPEIIGKIFDPFFTTKEIGKGTGLGLSTSMAIVRSHGGFLRVYSEPGRGTRFRVYLPALLEARSVTLAEEAGKLPRGDGQLILVVDDEASVRQITRQTLEAFGYGVLLACDGAEAVALYAVRRADIAVVLTDMMMPVMDGPATIQVLLRMNPRLRIIAASGLNANGRVAKAANAGVKHFLPKPYTAETLLKILAEVLSGKT